jgi:hypothetical protein
MANPIIKLAFSRSLTVLSLVCCLTAPHAISQTQSVKKLPIETEAQRLDAVRTLISQKKLHRLTSTMPDGKPKSTAAFCERMLDDLLNHKDFKAIEPVAVLDFKYPIQNADRSMLERDESLLPPLEKQQSKYAAKKLGPYLTKSIQRCTDEEANGDERRARVLFNGFNYFAGAPPFRAYVLPKNLSPFPESTFAYWSELSENGYLGRKGYSWVNLDTCEHMPSIIMGWDWSFKYVPTGPIGALTQYHDKLVEWAVSSRELRTFTALFYGPEQDICRWSTRPGPRIKK